MEAAEAVLLEAAVGVQMAEENRLSGVLKKTKSKVVQSQNQRKASEVVGVVLLKVVVAVMMPEKRPSVGWFKKSLG